MPSPSFSVSTDVHAVPATVFAYVSDLTKHPEWAANDLDIKAADNAPLGVSKRYASYANVRGREFHASLQVTAYDPPTHFAFSGKDETGNFAHDFQFEKITDGTRVTRTVRFNLSLSQYLFYLIALNSVRLPAARAALDKLKTKFA
jgi:uncharacterized protein YndB with AHSA1/START domain